MILVLNSINGRSGYKFEYYYADPANFHQTRKSVLIVLANLFQFIKDFIAMK